ncbi:MAG: hypothetical protein AB7V00_01255 [Bacilli bacterium]
MSNIKKFLFFLCLIIVAFAVTACGTDDIENPSLVINSPTITHVVNEDVDLLENITATDNETVADDIVIEISDLGGYDKTKVGTYTVTIKATDKAGNSITADITVTVTEEPVLDTEAPTLTIGKPSITHEINATVDLLADVSATDNIDAASEIIISISNYNGYDKSVEGTYEITVKATDTSDNFTTGTITVIVKEDILPPMVTGAVTTVTQLAGETVDLTKGLAGVDNKDGINVIFTVTNFKDYNKDVPGTYTVEITASDSSDNEGLPFNRTVVVEESYARAEMTSFAGDTIRYEALYNPQIMNSNTATGYNAAYDGHYVNVLSKEYLEWIIEYAPERLGAGVGWSVIAVTDADEKIVYVRHWNSGEAYHDEAGNLVSAKSVNWSTGTIRTWTEDVGGQVVGMSNAKYSSAEMGMMMANINEWVPTGGHVFIFINWSTIGEDEGGNVVGIANSATMPRSMGANYIMSSDENGDDVMDYAIGRTLKILDKQLTDETIRQSFDAANPFPIISIPSVRYITSTGIWKNRYTETVYLDEYNQENPFNPLNGVTANDGKGNDITSTVSYKLFRYQTTETAYGLMTSLPIDDPRWAQYFEDAELWKKEENEVTLEQAMVDANNDYYFVVQYQVTANEFTDTAYKLIQIKASVPDYIDLYGTTDSVFSEAMGIQQRLDMNPNLEDFGSMTATEKGIIYTASAFKDLTTFPALEKGVIVVVDPFYRIQLIRIVNGIAFEMDATGTAKTTDLTWTASQMFSGLDTLVPAGGYVIVYPEGLDGSVLTKALKAYYDYNYQSGLLTEALPTNGKVSIEMIIKEVKEVSTFVVNDVAPQISINNTDTNIFVVENNKASLVFSSSGGGAGFRLDTGKAYYYTKAEYAVLSQNTDVVTSFTTLSPNKGVPWFRDGVIIVVDSTGKFVQARVMTTSAAAEVRVDGTVVYGNAAVVALSETAKTAAGEANLTWDLVLPNAANTVAHGPLADIQSVIPDGGAFYILPGTANTAVRNYAISLVWNTAYPGSGIIVDATLAEQPVGNPSPATNGFDFTNYNAAYFAGLTFKVQFVSTITAKPAKIARPVATITDNVLAWEQVENAGSYDVYVDGILKASNVGELLTETTTFNYDLRLLKLDDQVHTIQVRAITANAQTASTSVLSDAVTVQFIALTTPANLVVTDTVLSWGVVDKASTYEIYVNDVLVGTSETNSFDLKDFFGSSTKDVQVKALPGDVDKMYVASPLSDKFPFGEPTTTYLTLTLETQHVTYTTVDEWMVKRNITIPNGGFSGSNEIFLIEDAYAFTTFATPTSLITVNGTFLLFGADGKLKAIRTIIANHQWLATNDQLVNNGWTTVSTYTNGQVKVSEVTPLLAEGDFILVTTAGTTKQPGATLNARDFLAYHFMGSWDTTIASNEIWRKTIDLFSNPSTVTYKLSSYPVTYYLALTLESQHVTYTTVDEWMVKRNVTIPNGGFSGSNEIFYIEDAFAFTTFATPTSLITANGTFLLFGADGKLKAVRTIINNHQWLATNDPLVNNGWTTVSTYTTGQVKVSEVTPLLAEGDFILVTTAGTTKQEGATLNARDFLAYHFMGSWDTTIASNEIWRKTIDQFINPTAVTYSVVGRPYINKLALTLENQQIAFTTVDEWMAKRNIVVASGGFSGSTNIFYIEDAYAFSTFATPTALITVNGTFLLFGADNKLKAVRTVLNNHQWLATNDPLVNNGWTIVSTYTSGQVKVQEITSFLAEGDYIILSNNVTSKQVGATLTPRDFLAYHFMGPWDTAVASNEIWRKTTFETFINPSTVTFAIKKVVVTF